MDAFVGIDLAFAKRKRLPVALCDAKGIGCIPTPSAAQFGAIREKVLRHLRSGGDEAHLPHANQLWMLAGFAMFERLRREWECLEVFPQATAVVLGANLIHKSKPGGVAAQLQAAARRTGWPRRGELRA